MKNNTVNSAIMGVWLTPVAALAPTVPGQSDAEHRAQIAALGAASLNFQAN